MFRPSRSVAGWPLLNTMAYLTITPAILKAIEYIERLGESIQWNEEKEQPSEAAPFIGKPISHIKILDISKRLRDLAESQSNKNSQHVPLYHVDDLLRGSQVYVEPPEPKPEPVCSKLWKHMSQD